MFFSDVFSHGEGPVHYGEVPALLGLDDEEGGPGPLVAVDDGLQLPQLVGAVVNGDVLHVLLAHARLKQLRVLVGSRPRADPVKGHRQGLVLPAF